MPLYPVVPGRLISINGEPVQEIVSKDSSGDRATQRDLSLTWAADLPAGNVLTAGTWWSAQPTDGVPGVSVEAKVAESLKLKLNDHLLFTIGGENREARVTSLRTISGGLELDVALVDALGHGPIVRPLARRRYGDGATKTQSARSWLTPG